MKIKCVHTSTLLTDDAIAAWCWIQVHRDERIEWHTILYVWWLVAIRKIKLQLYLKMFSNARWSTSFSVTHTLSFWILYLITIECHVFFVPLSQWVYQVFLLLFQIMAQSVCATSYNTWHDLLKIYCVAIQFKKNK